MSIIANPYSSTIVAFERDTATVPITSYSNWVDESDNQIVDESDNSLVFRKVTNTGTLAIEANPYSNVIVAHKKDTITVDIPTYVNWVDESDNQIVDEGGNNIVFKTLVSTNVLMIYANPYSSVIVAPEKSDG